MLSNRLGFIQYL